MLLTFLLFLSWCASLFMIIYGAKIGETYIWCFGLGWLFFDVIFFELFMMLKGLMCQRNSRKPDLKKYESCFPLCYHPSYNITACGLEKCHPFDSVKYGRVHAYLVEKGIIGPDRKVWEPSLPTRELLSDVMSCFYFFKL